MIREKDGKERIGLWIGIGAVLFLWLPGGREVLSAVWNAALPFLIAFAMGYFLRPMVNAVQRKTHLPRAFVGVFFSLLFLSAGFSLALLILSRGAEELQELARRAGQDSDSALQDLFYFFDHLGERLPLLSSLGDSEAAVFLRDAAEHAIRSALDALIGALPGAALSLMGKLPDLFLFVLVLIMATLFVCADYDKVCRMIVRKLPSTLRPGLLSARDRMVSGGLRLLRAYGLLFLLTFTELVIGFSILRIDYALVFAFVTAVIDILPVLGAGSVLLPFALLLFLRGETGTGIGMVILYIIITVIRQYAEPRIVGKSVGVPPILMLMAMYLGYHLLGVKGLLLAPVAALFFGGEGDRSP